LKTRAFPTVGADVDSDIKTRVTPLDELKMPAREGQDTLVIIYSSDARHFGKRHVLGNEPVMLGRGSENTIVLENDSVSRKHAKIEKRGRHYHVADLDSTNGTYVNDELVSDYQLRRGDQIKVGDTIIKYLSGSDVEAQYHETIYRMTIVDGLTGVNNKRYLMDALEREIPRARRHERPLSLMMFDIDHFKEVNDTFGHLAGDFVLKELAQLVKGRLRPDDVLGRYGGEEFAVVLPETPLSGGVKIAEELRQLVAQHHFEFEQERIEVTISVGVAQLQEGWDVLQFVKQADEKLYTAKRGGRNRVCS
jgi:diguanylate cyclase (GGDEF)-like protein